MRWDDGHESNDVEDRRGQGGGGGGFGLGALALLPFVKSRWGWGGVLVALALFFVVPRVLHMADRPQPSSSAKTTGDTSAHFAAFVLDDAQKVWKAQFTSRGRPYTNAHMVLYTDQTNTGCGYGDAATGPFYCPRDQKVYLDLGFFDELASNKFKAKGDFAQAYVIAHEIGHHVQHELGLSQGKSTLGAEGSSVRTELQADCFAGIWAHDTNQRNLLEAGDVDEAMSAAAAVGDDRLQKASRGTVRPDSFSHGTSAQRQKWFQRGFTEGKLENCDTFSASDL